MIFLTPMNSFGCLIKKKNGKTQKDGCPRKDGEDLVSPPKLRPLGPWSHSWEWAGCKVIAPQFKACLCSLCYFLKARDKGTNSPLPSDFLVSYTMRGSLQGRPQAWRRQWDLYFAVCFLVPGMSHQQYFLVFCLFNHFLLERYDVRRWEQEREFSITDTFPKCPEHLGLVK